MLGVRRARDERMKDGVSRCKCKVKMGEEKKAIDENFETIVRVGRSRGRQVE